MVGPEAVFWSRSELQLGRLDAQAPQQNRVSNNTFELRNFIIPLGSATFKSAIETKTITS